MELKNDDKELNTDNDGGKKKPSFRETFDRKDSNPNDRLPTMPFIKHSFILSQLINEISTVNFWDLAAEHSEESLQRKHYIQLVTDEVQKIAVSKGWDICINNGQVYIFNGASWEEIQMEELKQFLGKSALKMGMRALDAGYYLFRNDLAKQFMSAAYRSKPVSRREEVLINLKNGTLVITPDMQTIKPFEKEDFLTYQLKFELDPNAIPKIFQTYLDQVLPDKAQQSILAEFIGYVFIRHLKLEKSLICYGTGANGKSVFFDVVTALLGVENVSSYSLQSLTSERGYFRSQISNKLLNYASEISTKMDSTIFKQLVSGEPVEAKLLYRDPCIIRDYAKLIFNTNELPKDVEQNEAYFRRFIIVKFGVTIPQDERDPELAKKIIEHELPGVLNWVLDGLKRVINSKKFTYSEEAERTLEKYKMESDNVQQFLMDVGYVPDFNTEIRLQDFYKEYRTYCAESGYYCCGLRVFKERITRKRFKSKRKNYGYVVFTSKKLFSDDSQPTFGAPFQLPV